MQQRLAIARAVLHQPPLLLLDEPHTGLDQRAGEILDSLLRDIAMKGRTVVMTSHDLVRASELATRLDILSRGRISKSVQQKEFNSANLVQLYKSELRGEGDQL
jgi:heme exporter protein A